MLNLRWKISAVAPLLGWVLLVDPFWPGGGHPGPLSTWQNLGTFAAQQICESFRKQVIMEQEGEAQNNLKTLSVCVPEAAVHGSTNGVN